ncbi:hypothetical protein FRC07_011795, partial [Ceratobasidium sp. 392]
MSAHMINNITSTSANATLAVARNRAPVLGPVPMSTTRILAMTDAMNSRTLREQLLMTAPLHIPGAFESAEMRRSDGTMGFNANNSIHFPPELGAPTVGANILGSLRPQRDPAPLFMVRERAAHHVSSSLWRNHDFQALTPGQTTEVGLSNGPWATDRGASTALSVVSSPPSPVPSGMLGTPSTTVPREDENDSENLEMIDRIVQQLDYDDAHRDEATQALRLERLLETQRREREDSAERTVAAEVPRMSRCLGMRNGERMNRLSHPPSQSQVIDLSTCVRLLRRPAHVRSLARRRWQNALEWIAKFTTSNSHHSSPSTSSSEAVTPTNTVQNQANIAAEVFFPWIELIDILNKLSTMNDFIRDEDKKGEPSGYGYSEPQLDPPPYSRNAPSTSHQEPADSKHGPKPSQSTSATPSTSTLPPPRTSLPPGSWPVLPPACNYFIDRRVNNSVNGTWHLDTALVIPPALLRPYPEFDGVWNFDVQTARKKRDKEQKKRDGWWSK